MRGKSDCSALEFEGELRRQCFTERNPSSFRSSFRREFTASEKEPGFHVMIASQRANCKHALIKEYSCWRQHTGREINAE